MYISLPPPTLTGLSPFEKAETVGLSVLDRIGNILHDKR